MVVARDFILFALLSALLISFSAVFDVVRWVVTAATPEVLRTLCSLAFDTAGSSILLPTVD